MPLEIHQRRSMFELTHDEAIHALQWLHSCGGITTDFSYREARLVAGLGRHTS
jgi:hypothetical protein